MKAKVFLINSILSLSFLGLFFAPRFALSLDLEEINALLFPDGSTQSEKRQFENNAIEYQQNSDSTNDPCLVNLTAASGSVDMLQYLLDDAKKQGTLKKKINCVGNGTTTPLGQAVANNHVDAVKLLLKYGASVDNEGESSTPPLYSAIQNKNSEITLACLSLAESQTNNLLYTSYPIYRGLHAKRLLMIKKDRLADFAKINSLEQLKPLIALQQQSWSDYYVLKKNGLTVNGELDYFGMLKALDEGLGDYFPRSVTAIQAEINKYSQYDFVIEPNIMLQYTSQYYFYSNKENKHIIELLQKGLDKLAQKSKSMAEKII